MRGAWSRKGTSLGEPGRDQGTAILGFQGVVAMNSGALEGDCCIVFQPPRIFEVALEDRAGFVFRGCVEARAAGVWTGRAARGAGAKAVCADKGSCFIIKGYRINGG